jgi:N-acetylmuramic acid 6-phosphate etherase
MENEKGPITEQENPRTSNLSSLSSLEIVRLMNEEDRLVAIAVGEILPEIAGAVDLIVARLKNSGRLFYIGTGTSGRLGVLDASECPPTFGVAPEMVQAVIAGGYDACYRAVEASEDDAGAGAKDLSERGLTARDAVVGITASGRTPYTVGGLRHARNTGALTVAITCVPNSPVAEVAEVIIVPIVGPEVIAGSTRLKAGTAQKMVLNMLSTAVMIRLGYVSGNRMANLQARNVKLRARAIRILQVEAGLKEAAAGQALDAAGGSLPSALVMNKTGCSRLEAEEALLASKGVVPRAVEVLMRARPRQREIEN